ncbi:MAG TPA: cupin domain-containing protein [Acidimicrobiales bacterium]|nr:cupin domain-containing protein [Acidimicrobiales bacterium]
MPYYRRVGDIPPKRHTQFRAPDGRLYAEELMGTEGFSSSSSLLYHRNPPTAIVAAEAVPEADPGLAPNEPLLPRHLRTGTLAAGGDLVTGRTLLLGNAHVRLLVAQPTGPSGLYRNATGDEIVYLREGSARLDSVFGSLQCRAGDYVVIPTGTTHRWIVEGDEPVYALVIEARGHVGPPERYLSATGQFLEHSPYCERDLHGPEEPLTVSGDGAGEGAADGGGGAADEPVDVLVRQRDGLTRYRYAHHPFDVVGWDGCLYPYRLSIHDFEPVTGRVHQPPPVHQTFAGPRFVVCSFVPRKLDYHPLAVPVPYNHANVDSDEVLYYCAGDFTSREGAGIEPGSISLHPAGFIHGPQPGSVERALGQETTDEMAVMLDTFDPLLLADGARACDDADYAWSWATSRRA